MMGDVTELIDTLGNRTWRTRKLLATLNHSIHSWFWKAHSKDYLFTFNSPFLCVVTPPSFPNTLVLKMVDEYPKQYPGLLLHFNEPRPPP